MRFILLGLVTFVVAACTPVANFTSDQLNRATGDLASLVFVTEVVPTACMDAEHQGLCFDPADEVAQDGLLRVRGNDLQVFTEECELEGDVRARCFLGDVSEPTFVRLAGKDVGATITYRRQESSRVFQEIAVHP